jgi:hypothetical protein
VNDLAREKLAKLVIIHGGAILEDARLCEEALREACPQCRPEIVVIVEAHHAGVVARLREQAGEQPSPALAGELARQIQATMPVTDEAARWAVQAWASVMGRGDRVSGARRELPPVKVLPPAHVPPPVSVPVVVPVRRRERDRRGGFSAGRFVGMFLWSLIGGPLFALLLVVLCWAVLPGLFMLLGALADLVFDGFSKESMDKAGETMTAIVQAYGSEDTKKTEALFNGPASNTVTLWVWAIGSGLSVVLFLPLMAWSAMWSGPARSVGGTLILLPYLATLGAVGGAIIGGVANGRSAAEDGGLIGAAALALVAAILGLVAWISSLVKAARG